MDESSTKFKRSVHKVEAVFSTVRLVLAKEPAGHLQTLHRLMIEVVSIDEVNTVIFRTRIQ